MAEGFIVMSAARAAQKEQPYRRSLTLVEYNKQRVELCAAFDTLEYLKRGGALIK
jgi:fatty acid-binding protein DegV